MVKFKSLFLQPNHETFTERSEDDCYVEDVDIVIIGYI